METKIRPSDTFSVGRGQTHKTSQSYITSTTTLRLSKTKFRGLPYDGLCPCSCRRRGIFITEVPFVGSNVLHLLTVDEQR